MCFSGGAKAPTAPALPPEPPAPPTLADPSIAAARGKNRSAAALAKGRAATILTTPQGLSTPPTTDKKTLLGA